MKKIALTGFLVALVTAATGVAASAAPPHLVDPATVTPSLNPDFAPWTCFEAGSGITCKGETAESFSGPDPEWTCNGQPVYVTGTSRAFMTRWHTPDGLATKTVLHLDEPATRLTLSPTGEGASVTLRAHWNRHYVYPVPGDLDSRVVTEVGAIWLINEAGRGITLHDTGTVTYLPGHQPGEDIDFVDVMHGVHDATNDPDSVLRAICAGLT